MRMKTFKKEKESFSKEFSANSYRDGSGKRSCSETWVNWELNSLLLAIFLDNHSSEILLRSFWTTKSLKRQINFHRIPESLSFASRSIQQKSEICTCEAFFYKGSYGSWSGLPVRVTIFARIKATKPLFSPSLSDFRRNLCSPISSMFSELIGRTALLCI